MYKNITQYIELFQNIYMVIEPHPWAHPTQKLYREQTLGIKFA
jgi:hypothetical protein